MRFHTLSIKVQQSVPECVEGCQGMLFASNCLLLVRKSSSKYLDCLYVSQAGSCRVCNGCLSAYQAVLTLWDSFP